MFIIGTSLMMTIRLSVMSLPRQLPASQSPS